MITLEFRNELVNNRYSYNNNYVYANAESLGIIYPKSAKEIPFILKADIEARSFHKTDDIYEMYYSTYDRQLNGRTLTTNRIKEVLDSARCPILFKIGTGNYLIGKGFLAKYVSKSDYDVLFMATIPTAGTITSINEVKYYISRNIYLDINKKLQPVVKDFMALHKGEILITSDMSKYVGFNIEFPYFANISSKKAYTEEVLDYCLDEFSKGVTLKPLERKVVPVDKKKKEAELLASIRNIPSEIVYSADPTVVDNDDVYDEDDDDDLWDDDDNEH